MRRARLACLTAACALLVAGCSSSGPAAPTFVPSQGGGFPSEGPGVHISPIVPEPTGSGGGSGSGGQGGAGAPSGGSSSPGSKIDPLVVATDLTTPVGIVVLPDNTALVGERTTGRIVRVQPVAGRPVPTVRTLSGLDTTGDGGLLDLALSPDFSEDGLIYAYITTATDNRVVDFTLNGPVTPVLTGIPRGATGNAGRIAFGADGDLYVGTGDAGNAAAAQNPSSLAGKILRITAIGSPAPGNPVASSPVFASGSQGADGLCPLTDATTVLEVEPAAANGQGGEVNQLAVGASYGWPSPASGAHGPIATLPASTPTPGDCTVAANRLWVTSPDAEAVLSAALAGTSQVTLGAFTPTLARKYGRLKSIVAAADGALWVTTTNRDGHGHPVPADERVIRFMPSSSSGSANPVA